MTVPLSATSRTKLAKLLALLGSDKAGERDAAGLAAHRLVSTAGLSWQQVLSPPGPDKPLPELGIWRETVRQCLEHPGSLRPWEACFLRDLPKFPRLSTKQRYCLKEIADRVLERSADA